MIRRRLLKILRYWFLGNSIVDKMEIVAFLTNGNGKRSKLLDFYSELELSIFRNVNRKDWRLDQNRNGELKTTLFSFNAYERSSFSVLKFLSSFPFAEYTIYMKIEFYRFWIP